MAHPPTDRSAADELRPIIARLLGDPPPIAVRCWDGTTVGPVDAPATVVIRSPAAFRHLLYAPGELGLARAYVAGELDFEGDLFAVLGSRDAVADRQEHHAVGFGPRELAELWAAARRLGVLGRPLPPPPEEVPRLRGRLHSKRRDASAVSGHYDVGNDFYRLLLGPTLTYSCGYWAEEGTTLDEAQTAKYELVCAKLGLKPGMRLLDVGCGWGGMVLHAAREHGVRAVGITVSRQQHELAAKRVADAGLADQVEIRLQDYRDVDDGPFDAISSIGMFEHVGLSKTAEYLDDLTKLVRSEGRILNHAISRPHVTRRPAVAANSFMARYVFPDSALLEVGTVVTAMHGAGLEVRDVESLREHYARTLRAWLAHLEANWEEMVRVTSPGRARVWRLYLVGAALGFEQDRLSIHQVLAVKPSPDGTSGMPPTRRGFVPQT